MASVAVVEIAAKTNKGKPMPMPKNKNCRIFSRKPMADAVRVKRTAINNGLHGTTIAPKKKPNVKALTQGFLARGVRALGRNLPTSTLKINSRLMMSNMPKAMGETMPMTLVSDTSKMVVNTIPSKIIKIITPAVITSPNRTMVSLPVSFPDI